MELRNCTGNTVCGFWKQLSYYSVHVAGGELNCMKEPGEECSGNPQATRLSLGSGLALPVCSKCHSPTAGCKRSLQQMVKQTPGSPALPAPGMTHRLKRMQVHSDAQSSTVRTSSSIQEKSFRIRIVNKRSS